MNRSRRPHLARIVPLLCLVLVCAGSAGTATAGEASARGGSLSFSFLPQRAYQDATAAVSVSVRPKGVTCSLGVRYADGGRQRGLERVRAANGVASWKWHVATSSAAGPARVTASCGRAGSVSRTIVVVGSVIPIRIDVVKQGFSIRPEAYGGGTNVSYGLILRNTSPRHDAKNVTVLVNFVDSHNVLYGSVTSMVDEISAGSNYALGGQVSFPGGAPVARLEAVVQVGARSANPSPHPTLANLRVLPTPYDLAYVGSVEGELVNDQPSLLLQRATLSVVVFDADGNVLGGGTGYAFASLPPGGREFIKISSGLNAIPIDRAAAVQISVLATYIRVP